jgi:hypothetical protein
LNRCWTSGTIGIPLRLYKRLERTPDSIRGIEPFDGVYPERGRRAQGRLIERFERTPDLTPASRLKPHAFLLPIAYFVPSLDFLHVPTLDYLFEDALIQKILNIVFRYLGITQSDDFLYSS